MCVIDVRNLGTLPPKCMKMAKEANRKQMDKMQVFEASTQTVLLHFIISASFIPRAVVLRSVSLFELLASAKLTLVIPVN